MHIEQYYSMYYPNMNNSILTQEDNKMITNSCWYIFGFLKTILSNKYNEVSYIYFKVI